MWKKDYQFGAHTTCSLNLSFPLNVFCLRSTFEFGYRVQVKATQWGIEKERGGDKKANTK